MIVNNQLMMMMITMMWMVMSVNAWPHRPSSVPSPTAAQPRRLQSPRDGVADKVKVTERDVMPSSALHDAVAKRSDDQVT